MQIIPLSPVFLGITHVSEDVKDTTLLKVREYLKNNNLTSPPQELVKSTYHTGGNFLEHCELHELKHQIIKISTEYLNNLNYDFKKELRITSWLNVFDVGVMEAEHTHYKSIISGCYYVDSDNTSDSGNFYIIDQIAQREQNRAYYNLIQNNTHSIEPLAGRMLVFESWVRHGVYANKTNKPRISIAFNID
jgi:uncharacterized protein (TIGR02466 family)